MYCKNCGKEISEDFEICPYCKAKINEKQKFIPYYKRKDSMFQKHPAFAWSIFIIGIIVSILFLKISITETINLEKNWDQHTNKTTSTFKNY